MVRKLLFLSMAAFIVILQGCAMSAGKLVQEVSALDRPTKLKPREVDGIVKKYVVEGTSKAKVKEILASEGFKVIEEEMKGPVADCAGCERTVVVGRYDHRPMLSAIPDYGVIVEVGFRSGKAAVVRGWYVKSTY